MTRLSVPEFIESTQEKIRKLKVEENDLRRKKHAAAIKIQKTVRGWMTRNHLKMLKKKATTIQRYWRGYKGRLQVAEFVEKMYQRMVEIYYQKMATRIQALWRGYWSRKTVTTIKRRRG
uniref:Spermatogenesis-associated protein 17 n=1 Tax=Lygus hesperus TaxID=30085 RepID=A0A0A9YAU4_LYGHE